jgi:hypothetical protein
MDFLRGSSACGLGGFRILARSCFCVYALAAGAPCAVSAQSSGEEVIVDPELAAHGGSTSSASSGEGEVLIEDPELAGTARPSANGSSSVSSSAASEAPSYISEAHLTLHSRLAMDLRHSDPREETWENTNLALLEMSVRRSESLRFAVGTRLRLFAGALSRSVPDAEPQRVELDATPTAGYVDWNVASGLHLQVGYQPVHLGRFDLVSATDVLTTSDSRNGPATLPEGYEVGQLAARIDLDASDWLSLRAIYVPFFTPYIMSVTESDYGLLPLRQADVSSDLRTLGLSNFLAQNLSRADRERFGATGLAAFAPEVGLSQQQAALRVLAHGAFGEVAVTAATAVEKMPSIYFAPEAIAYLVDSSPEAAEAFEKVERPIRVAYNRFAMVALDAAFDVEPLTLGFEAAYSVNRTLPTLGSGPYPGTLPLPDQTDLLQVGARLEYLKGSELFATVEAFGWYTLALPADPTRGWMFMEAGRYLAGVAAGAGWSPAETHLQFELGLMAMTGPTLFLMPRVGYTVVDGLQLELGALIIEGPVPPMMVTPRIAIGTVYDTVDQVWVGFIYTL